MEEKKTLTEIIKEAGHKSNDFVCALCVALGGVDCGKVVNGCNAHVANLLLEAIDREYVERPRFEDGEPVQKGDAYLTLNGEKHILDTYEVAFDGSYALYSKECTGRQFYLAGDRVKCPKTEVVGADGKPIRVDETVYAVGYDRFEGPCEVTELKVGGFATVRWNDNSSGAVMASHLTHEQPDSLERIDADADLDSWDYCEKYISKEAADDDHEVCDIKKAHHLLARQRRVLERERNE